MPPFLVEQLQRKIPKVDFFFFFFFLGGGGGGVLVFLGMGQGYRPGGQR